MAIIFTECGREVLIDDEDLSLVSGYRWRINHYGYVVAYNGDDCIYLSRHVMRALPKEEIDHRYFNKLDNRKSELRRATKQQNAANTRCKRKLGRTSHYKGVFLFKRDNRWAAQIQVFGKSKHLGYFDDEVDAAKAYDAAAKDEFGEFAHVNFSS